MRGVFLLVAVLSVGCRVVANQSSASGLPEGSVDDSGSGGGSGGGFPTYDSSTCQPGGVASYQPAAYRSASPVGQGACVGDDAGSDPIQEFYESCLDVDAATVDSCNAFREQNATCAACILTPQSAAHYGPLIDFTAYVTANVAGCIEVAPAAGGGPEADALSCAKSVQALGGCELAACGANCPVHDPSSLASFQMCTEASELSGCDAWATAASCAQGEQDGGGLASACLDGFQAFYQAIVPLFCGPPAAMLRLDAGVGAGPDAGGGLAIDAGVDAALEAGLDAGVEALDEGVEDAPRD